MHAYFALMYVCVPCIFPEPKEVKRLSGALELGLRMVVNHPLGAGNWTKVLCFLQPLPGFLWLTLNIGSSDQMQVFMIAWHEQFTLNKSSPQSPSFLTLKLMTAFLSHLLFCPLLWCHHYGHSLNCLAHHVVSHRFIGMPQHFLTRLLTSHAAK